MCNTTKLINREKNKAGWRGKVNAKCIDCIYDPSNSGAGSWIKQVDSCIDTICPIWAIRKRHRVKP